MDLNEIRHKFLDREYLKKDIAETFIQEVSNHGSLLRKININVVENSINLKSVGSDIYIPVEAFEEHSGSLIGLIAQRVGIDLEELTMRGGTDESDPYLSMATGILKKGREGKIPEHYLKLSSYIDYVQGETPVPFLSEGEKVGVPPNSIILSIDNNIKMSILKDALEEDSNNEEHIRFRLEFLFDINTPDDVIIEK